MRIEKHKWPALTRPCRFSLSLKGGSVFADFNVDRQSRVILLRISFDGYGCYEAGRDIAKMSVEDSRVLIEAVDNDCFDCDEVKEVLYRYFEAIKDDVWSDALKEHGLLK